MRWEVLVLVMLVWWVWGLVGVFVVGQFAVLRGRRFPMLCFHT